MVPWELGYSMWGIAGLIDGGEAWFGEIVRISDQRVLDDG